LKVSGFSFIKNAVKYDYPIVEAMQSILPVCDDFYIAVGKSEDKSRELIESINSPKIHIIDTVWDDNLRKGGAVLAKETDKAIQAIPKDSDWAFYIQGDEVVHEKYLENIYQSMLKWKDNSKVEALLFKYLHFYGSYDYIGSSSKWYRKEIRIIKNSLDFFSFRDAQGFRKKPNNLLRVKEIDAWIYHYGWVKNPQIMQKKQEEFNKLWHDDEWIEKNVKQADAFDYSNIDELKLFTGTHPKVIADRINKVNWKFDFDISKKNRSFKELIKRITDKLFGVRIGEYRNYKSLK
jgi:hypothetical protein